MTLLLLRVGDGGGGVSFFFLFCFFFDGSGQGWVPYAFGFEVVVRVDERHGMRVSSLSMDVQFLFGCGGYVGFQGNNPWMERRQGKTKSRWGGNGDRKNKEEQPWHSGLKFGEERRKNRTHLPRRKRKTIDPKHPSFHGWNDHANRTPRSNTRRGWSKASVVPHPSRPIQRMHHGSSCAPPVLTNRFARMPSHGSIASISSNPCYHGHSPMGRSQMC